MQEPQHLISLKAALQAKRMPLYRNIVRWGWRIFLGGMAAVALMFLIISMMAIPFVPRTGRPLFGRGK
jgi:hypothetical protein